MTLSTYNFQPFEPQTPEYPVVPFTTESWSGEKDEHGDPAIYWIEFECEKKIMRCSCMDATCRIKNYKPIGSPQACKHSRLASQILWPVIAKALGVVN